MGNRKQRRAWLCRKNRRKSNLPSRKRNFYAGVSKAKIFRDAKTSKKEGRDPSINCRPWYNKTNCPRISMQPVSNRNLQFQKNINGLRIDGHYANASTQSLEPTEYSVPIPVDLFVAAPEISDWRRGRRSPKNGRRSSSIISEYSRLSAKTAPPIHGVTVYTREDGSIFAALYGDGAHRLCAAKRRGDNDILCTKLNIIQID